MSSRKLALMKPQEIARIIDTRTGQITDAEEANRRLEARKARAQRIAIAFQYNHHQTAMEKETIAVPADVALLKALTNLDIRPLDRSSVMRYQNAMTRRIFNLLAKGIGFPLFFSGIIGTIIVGIGLYASPQSLGGLVAVHTIWGLILGIGAFLLWAEHAIIPRREWNVSLLQQMSAYTDGSGLIPDKVFDITFAIREAFAPAEFRIHYLGKEYGSWFKFRPDAWGRSGIDPDPFLEVCFAGESYFIAVWDEPGFDGKLMEVE